MFINMLVSEERVSARACVTEPAGGGHMSVSDVVRIGGPFELMTSGNHK